MWLSEWESFVYVCVVSGTTGYSQGSVGLSCTCSFQYMSALVATYVQCKVGSVIMWWWCFRFSISSSDGGLFFSPGGFLKLCYGFAVGYVYFGCTTCTCVWDNVWMTPSSSRTLGPWREVSIFIQGFDQVPQQGCVLVWVQCQHLLTTDLLNFFSLDFGSSFRLLHSAVV